MAQKIGILGGIGPEASARFYAELIKRAQALGLSSNVDYPHIVLESIPAPELFLESPDLSEYISAVKNLERAGADFIVMVCNTAYLFLEELKSHVSIPFVDLKSEVKGVLERKGWESVMVIGSAKTMEGLFDFDGIDISRPSTQDASKIDDIIFTFNKGGDTDRAKKGLEPILREVGKKNLLLACTELSTILQGQGYLDTFDILLDATFSRWKNS